MKDRIRQLAAGQVVTIVPELVFTPEHFDGVLAAGMLHTREIIVKSRNAALFKAFFSSTDARVRVSTRQAVGHSAVIVLEIDARQTDVKRIQGEVTAVTAAGEKHIPYDFSVEEPDNGAVLPQTVEELADFARREPEQAARVFGTREFERRSDICRDGKRQGLRRGLLVGSSEQQALESFLVACGAKEPVAIEIPEKETVIEIKELYTEGGIRLKAKGWGLFRGSIESDSEWLCPRRLRITQKDFADGEAVVPYTLDSLRMHAGKNFGRISIRVGNTVLFYEVTAIRRSFQKKNYSRSLPGKLQYQLTKCFCGLVLSEKSDPMRLSAASGTEEKRQKRDEFAALVETAVKEAPGELSLQLARAWLLIGAERGPEARRVLEWCAREISRSSENRETESVVLKLLAGELLRDEEMKKEGLNAAHRLYAAKGGLVESLLEIYLVREAKPEEELELLAGIAARNPASSVPAAFAERCLLKNPKALSFADDFMVRVLYRLQKSRRLSAALVERFLTFGLDGIRSRKLLRKLLAGIYEVTADRRALSVICRELISSENIGKDELRWLEDGVRRELPINGLYDAYVTAAAELSADVRLPESLLYYYSYKNTLGRDARLFLYTYITSHCEAGSDLYKAYEEQMDKFALRTLLEGKPEPGLAGIYDRILIPEFIDEHLARIVPDLLYAYRITAQDQDAVRVVVHYPELTREFSAQLAGGSVCVPVYTENAAILFENAEGMRYCASYRKKRQMRRDSLLEYCRRKSPDQLMTALPDMQKLYSSEIADRRQLDEAKWLWQEPDISASCRRLLEERIVGWCVKSMPAGLTGPQKTGTSDQGRDLDGWLAALSLKDRPAAFVRDLVIQNALRGNMHAAEAGLRLTGRENIPVWILEKIAISGIEERGGSYSEELFGLCRFLSDSSEPEILSYLCRYAEGDEEWLGRLYEKAAKAGAYRYDLAERRLTQLLYTGSSRKIDEALSAWLSDGGKDETIQLACLCVKAHEAVTRGLVPDEGTGEGIDAALRAGSEAEVLKLALLLYYSGLSALDAQQKKACESLVYNMCLEDRYHPCFHRLARHIELPHQMEGRLIVSALAEPGRHMYADVTASAGNEEKRQSRKAMTEVYPGVYTAPVFLFPDESAQVGIFQGKTPVKEPFSVTPEMCYSRKGSVYDGLKELIEVADTGNTEEWAAAFERYMRKNKTAEDLFPLYQEDRR